MTDPAMRLPSRARARTCFALAVLSYLGVALWLAAPVLPDPAGTLLEPGGLEAAGSKLGRLDQQMVLATVVRNANVLVTEPGEIFGYGQCYPFPGSHRLGEHMFGEGVLAVVPWTLTRHPILTFNGMIVLALLLPGVTMYLLAHRFTGSPAAAFVAGLVLMLAPPRLLDVVGHPYLYADWALPLVLLCLHRLFVTGRWVYALGTALFLSFEALETIYVLLAVTLVVSVYGVFGLAAHRGRLRQFGVPLVAAAALSVGFAWWILGPYLDAAETWGTLSGRGLSLMGLSEFGPGHKYFPGVVAVGLALVALVDRIGRRRATDGEDPRWAMLVAAVVVIWASSFGVPVPGTDVRIPGLFEILTGVVPGLDAVRALRAMAVGIFVPIALLAGFGTRVLVEKVPGRLALGVAVVACLALVAERRVPDVARWSFGLPTGYVAYEAPVEETDVEVLRRVSHGATLHVPLPRPDNEVSRLAMARHLLVQSFDPRPSSLCYNSFGSPLEGQVYQLAQRLPAPSAAKALAALGFGTVVSHERGWLPRPLARFRREVAEQAGEGAAIEDVGEGATIRTYRLHEPGPRTNDVTVLRPGPGPLQSVAPGLAVVQIGIGNSGFLTYRGPMPIAPTAVEVHWVRKTETVGTPRAGRMLLPIALGPAENMRVDLEVVTPSEPGAYTLAVTVPADEPGREPHLVGLQEIQVGSPEAATEPVAGGAAPPL